MSAAEFGPDKPCRRTACAETPAHLGGAHLDPRNDLYDGLDSKLAALTYRCRPSASALLNAAKQDGWDVRLVQIALHDLIDEVDARHREAVACRADRDRGITEAMQRAEDCEQHGADIRYERHQSYWCSVEADRNNAERVAWVDAAFQIREAFANRSDPLAKKVVAFIDAAARGADRARKRHAAPTFADCQKAGRCEHPAPAPHAACEQLALDFSEMGAAA